MKIFAKRTKKKAESSAPRKVNKSDPIVEELLKKDASEWNAKERRMVKRYRERKAAESEEKNDATPTAETEKIEAIETEIDESKDEPEQMESDDSSSSSDGEEKEDVKRDDSDDGCTSEDDSEKSDKNKPEPSAIEKDEKTDIHKVRESDGGDGGDGDDLKVAKDHEIWGVLDKLNSKQKRTLSRKLERLGKSALEEVEQEANAILDKTMPIVVESKRDQTEAANTDKNPDSIEPKKKRRKKAADWSSLPAEERLRREDQRRKQQEAAERRARGESIKPGHNRPLNSARRRANRRKPKWASKSMTGAPDISSYKQEHHTSGFFQRKRKNQLVQEQGVNNY